MLAACGTNRPASVLGGECRIFERPDYEVQGKRKYDQDWIDSNIEGGVGGCGWKRPAQRPSALDAPAVQKPVAKAKKKPGLIKRIKDRFTAPSPPIEPTPYIMQPVIAIAPTPRPRDPVDELLDTK